MTVTLAPTPTNQSSLPSTPAFWRLSVERYHQLVASGSLTEDDNLELLEGYLVEKMTINPLHTFITESLRDLVGAIVPKGFVVNSQQPITTEDSEPEPDLAVLKGSRRDFLSRHASPTEVALLVEVADRSLPSDQGAKQRIYARAGVPVYWIVNIPERQVEVYTEPSGPIAAPRYRQLRTYDVADRVPVQIDGVEVGSIAVAELFPAD